jgi:hypothetical protein
MKFNAFQLQFAANKIMDSANYALAGLVFGQLVTKDVQLIWVVLGVSLYVIGWITAILIGREVKSHD